MAFAVALAACGDKIDNRFVRLCTDRGDTPYRCTCLLNTLKADVGEIDEQFVSFVADFQKWNVPDGGVGLDRFGIMAKYDLNEAEYKELTVKVGTSLSKGYQQCG